MRLRSENSLAIQPSLIVLKALVPGSSAVEQTTVNRLAGGSNPSRGAIFPMQAIVFIKYFITEIYSQPSLLQIYIE